MDRPRKRGSKGKRRGNGARNSSTPVDHRLEESLRNGRWDEALSLLEQGVDPATSTSGIYWAARGLRADLLRRFLAAGADPNLASSPRPLQVAAAAGWREGVELLLEHGADPGSSSMIGSALSDAIAGSHDEIAALLVRRGAPLSGPPGNVQMLPLAVLRELEETVVALLERGADPGSRASGPLPPAFATRTLNTNSILSMSSSQESVGRIVRLELPVRSNVSNTPALVMAATQGWARGVELLAAAGADVNAYDDDGRTAAQAAKAAGHSELADRILALGGVSEARRSSTEQLFLAVEQGDAAAVRDLLASGVSPDVPDPRAAGAGRSALMAAVLAGHMNVLEALLDGGANVDQRDCEKRQLMEWYGMTEGRKLPHEPRRLGMTALMYAAALGSVEAIRHLTAAGAALDLLDDTKHSALMLAAGNGHTEAVKALLEAGADPDLRGAQKSTALYLAAAYQRSDAVRTLLAGGANPNLRGDGDTPLQCAIVLGDDAMVRDLLAAGARALEAAAPPEPRRPTAADAGQYDPAQVRARLRVAAAEPSFVAAASALGVQIGGNLRDERAILGGFVVHVPASGATELDLEAVQRQWLAQGYFVFCCLSRAGRPEKLAMLPVADPLLAVAAMGTAAPNDGLDSLDVVGWLADISARHSYVLTTIERDTLIGRFLTPPADAAAMAAELYRLCPDAIDQGSGDLDDFARELAATGRFSLWWD